MGGPRGHNRTFPLAAAFCAFLTTTAAAIVRELTTPPASTAPHSRVWLSKEHGEVGLSVIGAVLASFGVSCMRDSQIRSLMNAGTSEGLSVIGAVLASFGVSCMRGSQKNLNFVSVN